MAGIYGWLPPPVSGPALNLTVVQNTADKILELWNLEESYGWDFSLLAMNSLRLGDVNQAIAYLLHPVFEQASQKIKRTKVRVFYNNHNPTNSYIILDDSPNKLSDLQKTRGWGFNPETAWEFEQ